MDIPQILEELAYDHGQLPREAIESAIAKREEITPSLLKILEEAIDRIDEILSDDSYQAHLYAMYLLAQFREVKAYPLIIRLLSFPGEIPYSILGEVLTEDMGRILASIGKKEIAPMQKLIEDPLINEYVRAACQTALIILVGSKKISREEILPYFHALFQKLERRPSFIWDNLVTCASDLYPDTLYNEIARAFSDRLIDRNLITLDHIHSILSHPKQEHLMQLFQKAELIEDTVTEMEKWISSPTLSL